MKIHTFEVVVDSVVEPVPGTSHLGVTYTARVTLGGVTVFTKDVSREMATGAPTRYDEVESDVMHDFATRLAEVLG
jgi:hypothetical protein